MTELFRDELTVERQLLAMGIAMYDLAVRNEKTGELQIHEGLFLPQMKNSLDWLYKQNRLGKHVLLRPHGEHGMSLIPGLSDAQVQALRVGGLEPAIVVMVDPDQYEVWLKHDRKLEQEASDRAVRYLAEVAGVAPGSVHWDAFGHIAGFDVPPPREQEDGEAFPAHLVDDSGVVFSKAKELDDRL